MTQTIRGVFSAATTPVAADGSVRLMPDFVDEELYRALSTRSGGEVTGIWD